MQLLNEEEKKKQDMNKCCLIDLIFVLFLAAVWIPDGVSGFATERRVLQAKTRCPVNFEFQNYSIITGQCKGPDYTPKLCCGALKEFACPYASELNDLTNDCADTMFSYITKSGNYPPGLFSSQCVEDRTKGLLCPQGSTSPSPQVSGINTRRINDEMMMMMPLLVVTLAWLPCSCFLFNLGYVV